MDQPQPDVGRTGWLRTLPAVASRVYLNIWFLGSHEGVLLLGDLDDPDAAGWIDAIAPTGLDEPYDPRSDHYLEDDPDEERKELERWDELKGYARERGLPMTTSRHVIDFMLDLNLIQKQETEIGVTWAIVSPLPNVDEVLNLPPERLEQESLMRWRANFSGIAQSIADWIGELRTPGAESQELTTSIEAVAKELRLDPEDARHGLAVLLNEDIRCDVDPETAAADAPLRLTVDWKLYEDFRTLYAATPQAEDQLEDAQEDDP